MRATHSGATEAREVVPERPPPLTRVTRSGSFSDPAPDGAEREEPP